MIRPAFIVEGHLEQGFVQEVCPGTPVRRIGCNGDDVSMVAIAKHIGTLARLLQRKCNPIIVVFDREQREESCASLENALLEALANENITSEIIVGIPDRDIEAWILADYGTFCQTVIMQRHVAGVNFEGKKCKGKLRELSASKCNYAETIHGVDWLKNAKPYKMKLNSPSFSAFAEKLKDLNCPWLQQEEPLIE